MRFSPVLLAVLAATATVSLAQRADAQTAGADQGTPTASGLNLAADSPLLAEIGSAHQDLANQATIDQLTANSTLQTVSQPERAMLESVAQANPPAANPSSEPEVPGDESSPQPANPPELTLPSTPTSPPDLGIDQNINLDNEFQNDGSTPPAEGATPDTEPPNSTGEAAPSDQPTLQLPSGAPTTPPGTPPSTTAPSTTPSTTTPTPPGASETPSSAQPEPRVLVAEVLVSGAEGDLQAEVYRAIRTLPGRTTTRSQLQEDINAIFATGFFSNVRAVPSDTPLGVRVTFEVTPNPVLRSVQLSGNTLETIAYQGNDVPIQQAVDDIFSSQYGRILNLRDFQQGVEQLNKLYQSDGYVLAQVIGAPQISPDGAVTLEVAEGEIEAIQIRFINKDGESVDEDGNPIRGRTREFIITREFDSQPGDVFNQNQIQRDLQRTFALGIFEDLNISLNPGQDPRKVDVVVNVTERNTGSFAAGIGISSSSGFFGTASLQEQNLGGNNQRLNGEVQVGQRDLLFDISFTDPWIGGDPHRTSYTLNAFGRQSLSLVFQGDDEDINLPNGDRPRVRRFGGGVTFGRPLGNGWRASVGGQFQQVTIRDLDGEISPRSEYGTLLSYDDSGTDYLTTVELIASHDTRNDALEPTRGSFLRLSTEQSIPIGDDIIFNRLRGSFSYFIPIRLTTFTPGCRQENPSASDCPETIAFNVQGGTVLGDLPPYEAFTLGGTDSLRGYNAGDVASSRSFAQATVEYRFPLFSIVSGALFADFGTDFGTQDDVPGEPGIILDKPGSGFDYGIGVRVRSPLGQIRVDYAINDQGDSRINFGIGQSF